MCQGDLGGRISEANGISNQSGDVAVSQGFTRIEPCNCEVNQREVRRVLQIDPGSSGDELQVTELQGAVRYGPERVTKGQVTTQFGRSFDELFTLGPGLHSICDCQSIGPKDAIFKPHQE